MFFFEKYIKVELLNDYLGNYWMSLIDCGECGKQISDKALICIGCGAPIIKATVDLDTVE